MITSIHILLCLSFLLPLVHAYSYFLTDVKPLDSSCFHETLVAGERLDLSFQVAGTVLLGSSN
jgi:hypothetical protein